MTDDQYLASVGRLAEELQVVKGEAQRYKALYEERGRIPIGVEHQAEAWLKVFDLCEELGMSVTRHAGSGQEMVLAFIRSLANGREQAAQKAHTNLFNRLYEEINKMDPPTGFNPTYTAGYEDCLDSVEGMICGVRYEAVA